MMKIFFNKKVINLSDGIVNCIEMMSLQFDSLIRAIDRAESTF